MPEKVHSRIDVKEAQIASADASELSHVRSLRKRFVGPRSLTLGLPNKAFHPTLLLAKNARGAGERQNRFGDRHCRGRSILCRILCCPTRTSDRIGRASCREGVSEMRD